MARSGSLSPCPVMVAVTVLPAGIRPALTDWINSSQGCGTGRSADEHPFGAGDQFVGFHDGLIGDLVNPTWRIAEGIQSPFPAGRIADSNRWPRSRVIPPGAHQRWEQNLAA